MPLYLVPTPIGHLKDITFRAIETLQSVSLILCEDTRKSAILLKHYNIQTPCRSYHAHNEHQVCAAVLQVLQKKQSVALITDAGTPGISDPAFLLVRACIAENITVTGLPGATAFVPALVSSGLSTERCCFEGFLPLRRGRKNRIAQLKEEPRTILLYEAPHKLIKTISDLKDALGNDRKVVLVKEISKIHERFFRANLSEALLYLQQQTSIKGEWVIVLEGYKETS